MIRRLAVNLALVTILSGTFTLAGCSSDPPETYDLQVTILDDHKLVPDRAEVIIPTSPATIVVSLKNERTSGAASNLSYRVIFAFVDPDNSAQGRREGESDADESRPNITVNANSQYRSKALEFKAGTYRLLNKNGAYADEVPSPDQASVTFRLP